MRLLLDQGLPRSTVRHLAGRGIAAEHVGDLGLAQAADFHAILATSRAASPSVVRIRTESLSGEQVASLIMQVLAVASAEIDAGAVVSITAHRMRVRLLPIGR